VADAHIGLQVATDGLYTFMSESTISEINPTIMTGDNSRNYGSIQRNMNAI